MKRSTVRLGVGALCERVRERRPLVGPQQPAVTWLEESASPSQPEPPLMEKLAYGFAVGGGGGVGLGEDSGSGSGCTVPGGGDGDRGQHVPP